MQVILYLLYTYSKYIALQSNLRLGLVHVSGNTLPLMSSVTPNTLSVTKMSFTRLLAEC